MGSEEKFRHVGWREVIDISSISTDIRDDCVLAGKKVSPKELVEFELDRLEQKGAGQELFNAIHNSYSKKIVINSTARGSVGGHGRIALNFNEKNFDDRLIDLLAHELTHQLEHVDVPAEYRYDDNKQYVAKHAIYKQSKSLLATSGDKELTEYYEKYYGEKNKKGAWDDEKIVNFNSDTYRLIGRFEKESRPDLQEAIISASGRFSGYMYPRGLFGVSVSEEHATDIENIVKASDGVNKGRVVYSDPAFLLQSAPDKVITSENYPQLKDQMVKADLTKQTIVPVSEEVMAATHKAAERLWGRTFDKDSDIMVANVKRLDEIFKDKKITSSEMGEIEKISKQLQNSGLCVESKFDAGSAGKNYFRVEHNYLQSDFVLDVGGKPDKGPSK